MDPSTHPISSFQSISAKEGFAALARDDIKIITESR